MSKSKKLYPILNLAFKIIIGLASIGYLIYIFFYQKKEFVTENGETAHLSLNAFVLFIKTNMLNKPYAYLILVSIFLMTLLNWGIEVLKWKGLIRVIYPVSNALAWKSILAGVALSNITPYRLGGIFARVALLPSSKRISGSALVVLGDVAVIIITHLVASGAAIILFIRCNNYLENKMLLFLSLLIFLCSLIGMVVFINLKKLALFLLSYKFFKRWELSLKSVQKLNQNSQPIWLVTLSLLRFIVIIFQYYMAFILFGWNLDMTMSLLIIATFLMIYHFLPTFNIIEFGATKSAVLLFLLAFFAGAGHLTFNTTLIIGCSSFIIWFLNQILPSLIGAIFLPKIKLLQHQ